MSSTKLKRAIQDHVKDFVAVALMILLAIATLLIILANQKAALPGWIPVLGQDFYSINAEFDTAQAITPGQGQAAVISGITVGKGFQGETPGQPAAGRPGSDRHRQTDAGSTGRDTQRLALAHTGCCAAAAAAAAAADQAPSSATA